MAREAGWGGPHWGARDRGEPRLAGLGFPLRGGPGTFGVLWDLAKSPSQQGRCRESPATPSAGTQERSLPARAGSWLSVLPFFPHWSSRSSVFGSRSKASLFTQTVDGANCEFMRDMPSCCYCYYYFDHSSSSKVGDRGPEGSLYFPPGYLPAFSVSFPPVWARALDGDCDMPQC